MILAGAVFSTRGMVWLYHLLLVGLETLARETAETVTRVITVLLARV
jgi:hypothetical protein